VSEAHFEVETVLDRSFKQKGTVTINRDSGLVTIRPFRSHKAYVVPLNDVATMIVQRAIIQEVRENRKPRKVKASRGLLSTKGF
jgi:hypothetical protein